MPAAAILVPREPLGLGGRRSLQAGRQRPRGSRRPRGVVAAVVARRGRDRCGDGALHHGLVEVGPAALPLCTSLISLVLSLSLSLPLSITVCHPLRFIIFAYGGHSVPSQSWSN